MAPDSLDVLRIRLSPVFAWLFRSRPRALAISDAGLAIERGNGTAVLPWTDIESLTGGVADMVARASGAVMNSRAAYELQIRGGERIAFDARAGAVPSVETFAQAIVQRAGLEWVDLVAGGRRLPSVALRPEAARRLRANLSGR